MLLANASKLTAVYLVLLATAYCFTILFFLIVVVKKHLPRRVVLFYCMMSRLWFQYLLFSQCFLAELLRQPKCIL